MTGPPATWPPVPPDSDFPVENLPFGVVAVGGGRRVAAALGEHAVDVTGLAVAGELDGTLADPSEVFGAGTLNPFLAAGREAWTAVRARLTGLLTDPAGRARVEPHVLPLDSAPAQLPFQVADYVDFYSSLEHATNLGRLLRPGTEPLTPNWRHLPVGYHGRAGTVVLSGTPVVRPLGQRRGPDGGPPVYGPSVRLDIEAEVGFVIGVPSRLGEPVAVADVREHVFGAVLVNDWSARDIQGWEYQPLGPFLGKSFATSISPWVVPLAALDACRMPPPVQQPEPLPHLRSAEPYGYDLRLEVSLDGEVISRPPFAGMYWTLPQQIAHATSNGAALRTGDLFASGTVSGPERAQRGSLMELSWGGEEPLALAGGRTRTFLEDGDTVTIRARTGRGPALGFGEVTGTVLPAPVR